MKIKSNAWITGLMGFTLLVCISCKETEDPVIPNEEELITTLRITFVKSDQTGSPVTLIYRDIDGDGGDAPVITSGTLDANTSYTSTIELLNESEQPVEDITEEVEEESDEHQFFYSAESSLLIDWSYADTDGDGNPVGLDMEWQTSGASNGDLTIILRHEPDKSGAGVADGNPENAGGETDIEVSIPLQIE